MVFQDPLLTLDPVLRIDTQMVEAILAHDAIPRRAALSRAREALVQVGVPSPEAPLKAYPHQCSGGTRQRVAVAIALLNRPELIIADEPTSALDVTTQAQIFEAMQQLTRATGTALIWITHDVSVIAGLADRVCVMYAGRVVEQGSTGEVLRAPGHPYTRRLLDSVPGNAPWREKLKQIPGMPPSLIDLPPGCAFRPRCPYATAECGETPEMRPHGATGRGLRCVHPLPPPA
jgi:peptide/nickel transport system ATP-binding protein